MTGPLVVLGVLSAVGGVLNLPHLRRRARGARALARAGHGARRCGSRHLVMPYGSTEYLPGGRRRRHRRAGPVPRVPRDARAGPSPARQAAPADTGFALVLNRKYYVDELYDAVIVRPLVWLSRVVLWKGVDQGLVDGAGGERDGLGLAAARAAGCACCRPARWGLRGALPRRRDLDPARRDPVTAR